MNETAIANEPDNNNMDVRVWINDHSARKDNMGIWFRTDKNRWLYVVKNTDFTYATKEPKEL